MALLRIERLGGLAGFGGAKLRSTGEVELDELPGDERQLIESLFAKSPVPLDSGGDRFRYRLTLDTGQAIELGEDMVPERLRNSVTDQLL
jgi:hypothetical protein